MMCPKCKQYKMTEDKHPSSPRGTKSCICGHIDYGRYQPPPTDLPGAHRREDFGTRVFKMVQNGCTYDHIMDSFPDIKRGTISKHLHAARAKVAALEGDG